MLIILFLTLPLLIASFSFVISDDRYGLVDIVAPCSIHVLWHGRLYLGTTLYGCTPDFVLLLLLAKISVRCNGRKKTIKIYIYIFII